MAEQLPNKQQLDTLLIPCRQCGTCCRRYRKVRLLPEEKERLERLGAHVGVVVSLAELRERAKNKVSYPRQDEGVIHMIHPDERGCIFLQKRNDKYFCGIYHYRPASCRDFRCNMADQTTSQLFFDTPTYLLGLDRFGLPFPKED